MRNTLYNSHLHVDLAQLRENLKILNQSLSRSPKVLAVIKADAYGHGAVEVAKTLSGDVAYFGVANVREGIALRQAGIEDDILVLGVPDTTNAEAYTVYQLTAVVSAMEHFDLLPSGTSYHLNFDTGMGRLGFREEELGEVLSQVTERTSLHCVGLMTHFATADEPGSDKVRQQLARFREIEAAFPSYLIRHVANTGGAFFYEETLFDMVRFGIALYGYPPGKTAIPELKPIATWKSHLAQVKKVRKGDTVSYLARWSAPKDGYIGVVPVGYGDGYPRHLSNRSEMVIGGNTYPQAGIVTMDYIMVDLGPEPLPLNAEVELMGSGPITADTLAELAGTINYELLCRITERVERCYYR